MLRIKNTNKPAAYTSNMKKKIVADLTSLAHNVLQLKNNDTKALKATAQELYEKLTVLEFVENYFEELGPTIGKAKAIEVIEATSKPVENAPVVQENPVDPAISQPEFVEEEEVSFQSNDLSELFVPVDTDTREVMDLPGISTISKMVEEMGDDEVLEKEAAIQEEVIVSPAVHVPPPVPVVPPQVPPIVQPNTEIEDLEKLTAAFQTMPEFERKVNNEVEKPVSLNDRLNKGFTIGMNDRLGFVKHLFAGSNDDLDRVMSQLSTMESLHAAKSFVQNMVKPDYNNWAGKEHYEERFIEILTRKFES